VAVPETPLGAPDVALSAELDGEDHISLDFSKPALGNRTQDPDLPKAANGLVSVPLPSPGNNTVPHFFTQYMRLGYYTAVTHSDAHFGMMMDALDASGLANDTLVVLFGDHGWELGEHTHVKFTPRPRLLKHGTDKYPYTQPQTPPVP
jgi:arylsulfatase A-like enzyme